MDDADTARLADRAEIADLTYRMLRCIDEHRFADMAGCFTEDVILRNSGGEAVGVPAVIAQMETGHKDFPNLQHLATNTQVDFTGDGEAEVWSNLLRFFADADGRVFQRRGARARIRALRTGDGWRFTRVQVQTVWAEG